MRDNQMTPCYKTQTFLEPAMPEPVQPSLLLAVNEGPARSLAMRPSVAERLYEEAQLIEQEDAIRAGKAGFLGRGLVQATLPYKEPDPDLPAWFRVAGDTTLIIKPGYYLDKEAGALKSIGYPYGSMPRLLLAWIGTEAVRTKSRELVLGTHLNDFMKQLGLKSQSGGKKGSITRLREMMKRLFAANMAIVRGGGPDMDFAQSKFDIADDTALWWNPHKPDEAGLWQSTVLLSERFFTELVENPVPIDLRALSALREAPMAIDLYCWLTYRNFSLRAPVTVPWGALYKQFGSDAAEEWKFRETLKKNLAKVLMVYNAKVEPTKAGLYLEPSRTSVPSRTKPW
jgi:Plasmid encoded RepA protein